MKKIILTFQLVVIYFLSNCQPYSSFFSDNITKYTVAHTVTCYTNDYSPNNLGSCISTFEYVISKTDTAIFNGIMYYVALYGGNMLMLPIENENEGIVIREDQMTGKMFRYFESINDEILICDMSLNEGDTFQFFPTQEIQQSPWNNYIERGEKIIVDSVRYINGKKIIFFPKLPLSCFYTNQNQYNISVKFIEGIGPTYGPYSYFAMNGIEPCLPLLLCVEKEHFQVFMLHEDLQCFQYSATINEIENLNFNIYPNPANDFVNIKSDKKEKVIKLYIYDFNGNFIDQFYFFDDIQISTKKFASGIYTLVFEDENNYRSSKKVVINH